MSQPFILNGERLMGQSNHRMPVAGKGGRRKDCLPAKSSSVWWKKSEGGRLGLTKGDPCRQSKDFDNEQRKGNFSALTQMQASRSIQGFKKKKKGKKEPVIQKRNFVGRSLLQNQHFSSILTLARAHSKEPFCPNRKILQDMSQNFNINRTGREMFS